MLVFCSGSIRQEIPACLRSGRFRDGAGVPRPLALRWAWQIMLQAVRFTYQMRTTPLTLNQPTSTDNTWKLGQELAGLALPMGRRCARNLTWIRKTLSEGAKTPVDYAVGRYFRSFSNPFIFNQLRRNWRGGRESNPAKTQCLCGSRDYGVQIVSSEGRFTMISSTNTYKTVENNL